MGKENWARHQTTKDEVDAKREAARERKANYRASKQNPVTVPRDKARDSDGTPTVSATSVPSESYGCPGDCPTGQDEGQDTGQPTGPLNTENRTQKTELRKQNSESAPPSPLKGGRRAARAPTRKDRPPASDLDLEYQEFRAAYGFEIGQRPALAGRPDWPIQKAIDARGDDAVAV